MDRELSGQGNYPGKLKKDLRLNKSSDLNVQAGMANCSFFKDPEGYCIK